MENNFDTNKFNVNVTVLSETMNLIDQYTEEFVEQIKYSDIKKLNEFIEKKASLLEYINLHFNLIDSNYFSSIFQRLFYRNTPNHYYGEILKKQSEIYDYISAINYYSNLKNQTEDKYPELHKYFANMELLFSNFNNLYVDEHSVIK